MQGYTCIRRGAIWYVTSDKRRTIDPVGMITDSIEGYLSYFLADDRFMEIFNNILGEYGIKKIRFLPTSLAEALYLIPRKRGRIGDSSRYRQDFDDVQRRRGQRDRLSVRLFGGRRHVVAQLYTDGGTDIPFEIAEAMVRKVNLSSKDDPNAVIEFIDKEKIYSLPMNFLKERVKDGLDLICEVIRQMSGTLRRQEPGLQTHPSDGGRDHGDPRRARTSFRAAEQGGGDHRSAPSLL